MKNFNYVIARQAELLFDEQNLLCKLIPLDERAQ